jgi:hypothetical protein
MQQGSQDGNDFVAAVQAEIDQGNRLAVQSLLSRKRESLRLFASKMTLCFSANLCVSVPSNMRTGQASGTCSAISSKKTRLNTISGQTVVSESGATSYVSATCGCVGHL